MKRKFLIGMLTALLISAPLAGCSNISNYSLASSSNIKVAAGATESIGSINTYINLDDTITISGQSDGVLVDNSTINILSGGTYSISGTLSDGQIIVDVDDTQDVYIVLNGVNITCSDNAPIYIKSANKTVIGVADDTQNYITDGETYSLAENSDEPDAAIYSKDDLTFIGNGALFVNANYNDGITGKDDLLFECGNINVTSTGDGIKGRDSLTITSGTYTIDSGNDGLKSSNDTDEGKGNVIINGGTINITSGGDGIQGETSVTAENTDVTITTGGGSENAPAKTGNDNFGGGGGKGNMMNSTAGTMTAPDGATDGSVPPEAPTDGTVPAIPEGTADASNTTTAPDFNNKTIDTAGTTNTASTDTSTTEDTTVSTKAIKAGLDITINSGTFTIDSCDDSIHSNSNVTINGGTFNITSGDDGMHADSNFEINDCTLTISKSYEGLESQNLTINGGNINVTSSDDGINVSGGNDTTSASQDPFASSGNGILTINGGNINVKASGDGLDANGSMYMNGGTVFVDGPADSGNAYFDYDSTFDITGGILVGAGSSGMAQSTSETSTQNSLVISLTSQKANTIVNVTNSSGESLFTFAPTVDFQSIVVSSPDIKTGETYSVSIGGSTTSTTTSGIITDGTYSGGTSIGSGAVSSINTNITQEGAAAAGSMGGAHGAGGGGKGNMMNSDGTMMRPNRN